MLDDVGGRDPNAGENHRAREGGDQASNGLRVGQRIEQEPAPDYISLDLQHVSGMQISRGPSSCLSREGCAEAGRV